MTGSPAEPDDAAPAAVPATGPDADTADLATYLQSISPQPWFGKTVGPIEVGVWQAPFGPGQILKIEITCEGVRHVHAIGMGDAAAFHVRMPVVVWWIAQNIAGVVTE